MKLLITAGSFSVFGGLIALVLMICMAYDAAPSWTPYVWPTCIWLGAIATDPTGHSIESLITRVLAVFGNAFLYGLLGAVFYIVVASLKAWR